ncbi:response regulator [Marinobacterium arenosum]|uniref:response regulator n=1 Tax=Marinobacterium arenosum TaxID=2862496 RepID=UPI001C948F2F|nr:response regulator [Marinobacterium arenosum]MBY4677689.1 response regulator [Marinobacterium arenosum]
MHSLSPSDLNILLVEPSAMQRKLITQQLQQESVVAIDQVTGRQQALERIRAVRPDLVISALHYADGSAVELLQQIRSDAELEQLPFMLVSSETRREQLESFKQSGVVAILPKPFTRAHLGKAINATLDLLSHEELELELYDAESVRVLVVDDSRMARKVIIKVLNNLGIHRIREAVDGADALQQLEQNTFDLVITDYNMPQVNGLELTEQIRQSDNFNHLPIMMVSSEANDAHLCHVSQAGVDAITDKPFEPELVKQLLARLLDDDS